MTNLSLGDYFSQMGNDNYGFKKSSPSLFPAQKPSACIFQLVSPLLKDPWANCWIFINQLNLMRWKDLFKRMKKGETDTESYSDSFPWKKKKHPLTNLGKTYSIRFPGSSSSYSNFHTLRNFPIFLEVKGVLLCYYYF